MNTQNNTTAPTTKLSKTAQAHMMRLIDSNGEIVVSLLSSFYQAQTTRYASCLNELPFRISYDKLHIVESGFSKSAKAIITLDPLHPAVLEAIAEKKAAKARAEEADARHQALKAKMIETLPFAVANALDKIRPRCHANGTLGGMTRNEVNQIIGFVGQGYNYARICGDRAVIDEITRQLQATNA